MKNKIIKNTVSLAVAVSLLGSCNGWLEATSSTQVSDATLYSSRSGFQDALCGVYISMGNEYEYGSYWTWYVNELVYGPYAPQSSPIFTAIQNHKWEDNRLIPDGGEVNQIMNTAIRHFEEELSFSVKNDKDLRRIVQSMVVPTINKQLRREKKKKEEG